jgi:hypothetical protein
MTGWPGAFGGLMRDYSDVGDINVLIAVLALLPYGVKLSQTVPIRIGDRIPAQRRLTDGVPWSMVHAAAAAAQSAPIRIPVQRASPQGLPPRSRIGLPRR